MMIIGQRHFRITDGRDLQKRPSARKTKRKCASIVSLRLVGNAIGPSHVYSTTNSSEYVVWQCFTSFVVEVGNSVPIAGAAIRSMSHSNTNYVKEFFSPKSLTGAVWGLVSRRKPPFSSGFAAVWTHRTAKRTTIELRNCFCTVWVRIFFYAIYY